ncbi:MAG: DUF1761 domain-containing protein [Candidatus Thermoplasmatota archaeon]
MDPTTFSFSGINWLAIAIAVVANMVIGSIWYMPKTPTGRIFMREWKFPADYKPDPKKAIPGYIMMAIGSFLTFFILSHTFWAYGDSYSNVATGGQAGYKLTLMDGLTGGFFVWLGFMLPHNFVQVAFEGRSKAYAAVNAGYNLVSMLVAGALMVTL